MMPFPTFTFRTIAVASALTVGTQAFAQAAPERRPIPNFPISSSVAMPDHKGLVFVSGTVPAAVDENVERGKVERYGDTETQTRSILEKIKAELAHHGLDMGDVVMMRVFLVAPPGEEHMDFAGMMRAYSQYFGTETQPNTPSRSAMQVAGLVDPGWLVEIEVTAAKR